MILHNIIDYHSSRLPGTTLARPRSRASARPALAKSVGGGSARVVICIMNGSCV